MKTDLTVEILKDIRNSIGETNSRLDALRDDVGSRIDQTNSRLEALRDDMGSRIDGLREELSRRIVESEIRTSTAIVDLAGSVREVATLLREQHDLRPRVARCESEIDELKRRIPSPRGL